MQRDAGWGARWAAAGSLALALLAGWDLPLGAQEPAAGGAAPPGKFRSALDQCEQAKSNAAIIDACSKALALWTPGDSVADKQYALGRRANAREDERDFAGAIADYGTSLALAPDSPDSAVAYNGRGWVYYITGDYARGFEDCAKALALDSNDPNTLDSLGCLYFELGQYANAASSFEKALGFDPKDVHTLAGLAITLLRQGKTQEAKSHFSRACELEPALARGPREAFRRPGNQFAPKAAQALDELARIARGEAPAHAPSPEAPPVSHSNAPWLAAAVLLALAAGVFFGRRSSAGAALASPASPEPPASTPPALQPPVSAPLPSTPPASAPPAAQQLASATPAPQPPASAPPVSRPSASGPATVPPDGSGIGTLLGGKYELVRRIGEGGMGLVYEGLDHSLERPVAVKQMRPEIKLDLRDKKRFLQEAKTSAALHHPYIVDIYAILEENGEVYLVFEFVDGQTLQKLLEQSDRLGPGEVKPLLRDVLEALAFAHGKKVIHRDLKPSNIMLTAHGHAKVMDFGIARQIKDTASRLTGVDTSGTMAYMAPEQELGRFDARSDLFSLAATTYELLSGEPPFPGPNFLAQKERMAFKPLLESAPQSPPGLARAVERCLRFEPKERLQSADEFSRAAGIA